MNKNKKGNRFFRGISIIFHSTLLTINLAIALLMIGAAFSDRVPPDKIPYISYLGMTVPFLAVGTLLFLTYWLLKRKWYSSLISITSLLVSATALFTYFPINYSSQIPPPESFKLLSYNIRQFNFGERDNNKKNPTLEYIAEQNADIICLQEFGYSDNNAMLRFEEIRKRLKKYPYYHIYKITDNHWHKYGLACFSKYPISDIKPYRFRKDGANAAVAYTLKIKGKKVRLFNCHLESNRFTSEDREFYKGLIEKFSTEKLNDFNTKIVKKMDRAFQERAKQVNMLRKDIDNCNLDLIICGDFNDTPISYAYRKMRGKSLSDAFVKTGNGLGITYFENHFYFRIDHILYSDSLKAYDCKVGKVKHSDHYPISCYFSFK
ncbi:MAG: endonuclease/exonuclease/phosphatase family protein [Bacteroidales bacterium]